MGELGMRFGRLVNRRQEMWRPFRFKDFGEGPPVVIIPGLDGLTEFFTDITPQLTPHYRVIVYYLPLLAEAEAAGVPYTLDFIADDLKSVLDQLGIDKPHIIGESFGGAVAQTFVLAHPEMVDRLILISTCARFELPVRTQWVLRFQPYIPQALFARLHVDDVCERHDPQWAKEVFVRGAAWADHRSVLARGAALMTFDTRDRIGALACPAMMVIGGSDHMTGRSSRDTAALIPGCEVVTVPNGGHLCHMVDPDSFSRAALDFLGRAESPKPKSARGAKSA
jgi:pimeloyl-ACP methyl ester carboxylesterase